VTKEVEDVSFSLGMAVPLGSLLTELVSNCLKHAFPNRSEGEVRICLRSVGEHDFELVVGDNGIGMPPDVNLGNPKSLGLDLVHAFVEQLNGTMEIRRGDGTEVWVKFRDK
jgi:two-component sensor histidine kinase